MMAQYPDVFIMTFSIHIPNFVLLSQTAQLLLIFCYAAPLMDVCIDGYCVVTLEEALQYLINQTY